MFGSRSAGAGLGTGLAGAAMAPAGKNGEGNLGGNDLIPIPPSPSNLVIADVPEMPLGIFIVPAQRRGRFKILHRFGDCSWHPGVDYRDFNALGSIEPPATAYSAKCKHCVKQAAGSAAGVQLESSASDSGSPSSGASSTSS